MDPVEEQQQELDVLRSIYPDELEELSEKAFNIHIALDTAPVRHLILHIEYPDEYPQVVPTIAVEASDGSYLGHEEDDEGDEDQADGPAFEFEPEDIKALSQQMVDNAEENVGMPSVFTLASLLKEAAEEMYGDKVKEHEKQKEREILIQEEKEQAKFRGTPVTPESFAKWREGFRKEMGLDKPADSACTKLTGREIFERGLNKDDEEEDDIKDTTEGVKDMTVGE
uniref:ARAD1A07436p n=1 Tax=Blastobotrys adeninivorans TaxID=409370 RepID=A0A060SXU6_BLAAD